MALFRNLFFYALFLSLLCHFIFLGFFSFRMPLKNIPSAPFINFLGSFLGPYDTQVVEKTPLTIEHTSNQKFKIADTSKTQPSLEKATKKDPNVQRLPALPKKTLPIFKAITPLPTEIENNATEDSLGHEPLTLPKNDPY